MNEDRSSESLRESLHQQFEDLNEALPELDLKTYLSDEYRDICEAIVQVQIEFEAMRQIVRHQLGVSTHAG